MLHAFFKNKLTMKKWCELQPHRTNVSGAMCRTKKSHLSLCVWSDIRPIVFLLSSWKALFGASFVLASIPTPLADSISMAPKPKARYRYVVYVLRKDMPWDICFWERFIPTHDEFVVYFTEHFKTKDEVRRCFMVFETWGRPIHLPRRPKIVKTICFRPKDWGVLCWRRSLNCYNIQYRNSKIVELS